MWIVDLAFTDAPERLAARPDPYFTTPGVEVVRVREWAPFLT